MTNNRWIAVRTLEADDTRRRNWELSPRHNDDSGGRYFSVHDPFNVRKAVVPLFQGQKDGSLEGLGTAFGISGTGMLLTADHVIAELRGRSRVLDRDGLNPKFEYPENEPLIAFLSPGVVFGTVGIRTEHLPVIVAAHTPIKPGDDPLRELRGELHFSPADIAVLRTQPLSAELHTLPLELSPDDPKIGDHVVAIGYPQIDTVKEHLPRIVTRVEEGMFACYGKVIAVHPNGRDRANGTPVFEVDAHWPSGMSGGPVLNADGKVVGIVSRSLEASDEHHGVGWATWLGRLPEVGRAVRQAL
ncbi:S1 family peptidase [Mesorhizobium sp. Cs1299R1N3]|uniref:S1 family peptidase n=1 Tax=Mesorhizobium sp. Cs1299R1N3 TaxID=3015173 RepID=UPI00301BA1FB